MLTSLKANPASNLDLLSNLMSKVILQNLYQRDKKLFTNDQLKSIAIIASQLLKDEQIEGKLIGQILYFGQICESQGIHDEKEFDMRPMFRDSIKVVFNHMRNLPLIDISAALRYIGLLENEKKMHKFITKLQNHLEMTSIHLFQNANQHSVIEILRFFRQINVQSHQLTEKCAELLKIQIDENGWEPLDSLQIGNLLSSMKSIDVQKH